MPQRAWHCVGIFWRVLTKLYYIQNWSFLVAKSNSRKRYYFGIFGLDEIMVNICAFNNTLMKKVFWFFKLYKVCTGWLCKLPLKPWGKHGICDTVRWTVRSGVFCCPTAFSRMICPCWLLAPYSGFKAFLFNTVCVEIKSCLTWDVLSYKEYC